jgi:hypothetical protein
MYAVHAFAPLAAAKLLSSQFREPRFTLVVCHALAVQLAQSFALAWY